MIGLRSLGWLCQQAAAKPVSIRKARMSRTLLTQPHYYCTIPFRLSERPRQNKYRNPAKSSDNEFVFDSITSFVSTAFGITIHT